MKITYCMIFPLIRIMNDGILQASKRGYQCCAMVLRDWCPARGYSHMMDLCKQAGKHT